VSETFTLPENVACAFLRIGGGAFKRGSLGGGVQTFGCNIELDVIEDATPSVSQHTGETTVYVDRSNKKYHSKPNCSGMKNPKSIPLSQAKKKYTACKKCCK